MRPLRGAPCCLRRRWRSDAIKGSCRDVGDVLDLNDPCARCFPPAAPTSPGRTGGERTMRERRLGADLIAGIDHGIDRLDKQCSQLPSSTNSSPIARCSRGGCQQMRSRSACTFDWQSVAPMACTCD